MVPQRRGKIPKGNVRGANDLLGRVTATVTFALLHTPLFPTAAGRLPKGTMFQAVGQVALIDPAFGIIVRILVNAVLIATRAMAIA